MKRRTKFLLALAACGITTSVLAQIDGNGAPLCIRSISATTQSSIQLTPNQITAQLSTAITIAVRTPGIQPTTQTNGIASVTLIECSGKVDNVVLTSDVVVAITMVLGLSPPVTVPVSQPTTDPATQPVSQPTSQPATGPVSQPTSQPAAHRILKAPFVLLNKTGNQSIRDCIVRGNGQGQNIVVQSVKGTLTVDNVVSVDAWGDGQFSGQGIYLNGITGSVTITNSYFGWNGRPRNPPVANGPQIPTPFRHDIYGDSNIGHVNVTGCVFGPAANAGVQTRSLAGCEFHNCIFLDCGTAILIIQGAALVDNCIIWGGQYYYDGSGDTGNTAIRSYWPFRITQTYVLSRAGQLVPNMPANPQGAKYSPQGGVNVGGVWVHTDPVWTPPPGFTVKQIQAWQGPQEYISGYGNVIDSDWPGGLFLGPSNATTTPKHQGVPSSVGFATLPGPGPALDYVPILKGIEDGGSVPDAIAVIRMKLGVR